MRRAIYIIDANFFIKFHKDLLPPDIYPAFWDRLRDHFAKGNWILLDCVKNELEVIPDELGTWIKDPVFQAEKVSDEETIASYRMIISWLEANSQYTSEAKQKYAACADSWIVAYAHAHDAVIVTREVSNPDSKATIKIPDIAKSHGVESMNVNTFMRQQDVAFVFSK